MYNDSGYVVCNEYGNPVHPGYISSLFGKFIIEHELPHITLHGLRHSVESIANSVGVSMFDISKMLGHADLDTTSRVYSHLFDETQREAVNAVASALHKKKKDE